jgi:cation transport ATPase
MSKILAKLFGGAGASVANKIGNLVDKFVQTKEEKAEFQKQMDEIWINAEADMQKNVTERWKVDMNSDSWLSKNVRPLVLIFLVVSTVLMVFIDAGVIEFEVKANWIDLLQLVLITVIGAYFGGRSIEKTRK